MTACSSCGASVAVENVFPGGSVQCACGATVVAPAMAAATAVAPRIATTSTAPAVVVAARAPICPRCSSELVVRDLDGVVVAACPSSHGLFATDRALEGLAHVADGERADDAPVIACPRCAEAMTPRRFTRGSSVVVDVCEAHGTWLDAGELQAAAAAVPAAMAAPVAGDDADEATRAEVNRRAAAILDVSLALEAGRDEETARRAVDVADDLVDTFNFFVLGRTRSGFGGRRYR